MTISTANSDRATRTRAGGSSSSKAAGGGGGTKKRKAPAEPSEPSTPEADALRQIEAAIADRRARFAAERERVSEMRAQAASMRAEASSLGASRATMRRAQSLAREADAIEAKAARIETGADSAAFQVRAERYLSLARANAATERDATSDHCAKRARPDTGDSQTPMTTVATSTKSGTASSSSTPSSSSSPSSSNTNKDTASQGADGVAAPVTTNAALWREYRAEFEEQAPPMHIVQHDACPTCAVPLLLSVNGALLTCPECRAGYPYMDATTASMAYGDEVEFLSNNPKKAHHFEDRLKMFQGKGSKRVTKEVLDAVMEWHVTQGITSVDDITTLTVRQALKANAFKDLYDFEMYIWCSITGKPAPVLGPTKENYCRQMFMRIQAPYAKWKARINPTRVNFLSYVYVLYKFFQLLNWVEFLPYFSLLKGRDKLEKQEAIWKGICHDVNWPFIPAPTGPPAPPRPSTTRPSSAAQGSTEAAPKAPSAPAQPPKPPVARPTPHHVRTPSALLIAMNATRASRALPS
ncbi:Poxvirus Late Transcription Factor VLTF3 like protein [Pandoravirus macleodensis]|uniref:Poxvirus Late Transcription Factor VLTF3 like protein n=1 Tax=Pandoravirus macleodensis TaxID=2107707 RepID=A0A2U7UEY2_9VIRU|nr:Poxvirus Late Transcription Factor VLTF3 like protein [Pandoravirus macleodensis]AVK76915.1 Poxvirus Late Transcription Factor VLTF3 like protein [Pandoravirus macleodensis]